MGVNLFVKSCERAGCSSGGRKTNRMTITLWVGLGLTRTGRHVADVSRVNIIALGLGRSIDGGPWWLGRRGHAVSLVGFIGGWSLVFLGLLLFK